MLDATREAISYAEGKERADLDSDTILYRALVKCIEIVGAAAASIGQETRQTAPAIPWRQVVAMRNRLLHAYFDINKDVVWQTVKHDMPPLVGELAAMLAGDAAQD